MRLAIPLYNISIKGPVAEDGTQLYTDSVQLFVWLNKLF